MFVYPPLWRQGRVIASHAAVLGSIVVEGSMTTQVVRNSRTRRVNHTSPLNSSDNLSPLRASGSEASSQQSVGSPCLSVSCEVYCY